MNPSSLTPLLDALAGPGWHVDPDFLRPEETQNLRDECLAAQATGVFHAAGVSRQATLHSKTRGDQVLWVEDEQAGPALKAVLERLEIMPAGGTLVTFLSERFWHQVLPAHRQRLSLTGWFRRG